MTTHPIEILAQAIASKQPVVLVTIVEVKGASPAKVGAQIVLLEDGMTAGTVGGGKLESAILDDARLALTESLSRLPKYSLTEEGTDAVGTLCGGEVRVFIQPEQEISRDDCMFSRRGAGDNSPYTQEPDDAKVSCPVLYRRTAPGRN